MSRAPDYWRVTRIVTGVIWAAALAAAGLWIYLQGLGVRELMRLIYDYVVTNPYAPVIYIILYGLRPLTFLPAMWFTIAAGGLFGFVPGLIYGLLGENVSANSAYLLARFFRHERLSREDPKHRIDAFKRLLVQNAFPTVVVLRASFLPFDLVNYACGLLRVPWVGYMLGSIIGMLPPMITFVSFGASVNLPRVLAEQHFSPEQLIDTKQLLISAALVVASAIVAFVAHRRRKHLARIAEQRDSN